MDATKIKVGDKIRLRSGDVKTVADVVPQNDPTYPMLVEWGDGGEDYTKDGLYMPDSEYPLDILEVIPEETTDDIVNKPAHYARYEIEPVTFTMKNGLDFATGNIVKYALRAGHKTYEGKTPDESAVIDLQKVIRYAEMKINLIKGEDVL